MDNEPPEAGQGRTAAAAASGGGGGDDPQSCSHQPPAAQASLTATVGIDDRAHIPAGAAPAGLRQASPPAGLPRGERAARCVVALCGLPGAGKTAAARAILGHVDAAVPEGARGRRRLRSGMGAPRRARATLVPCRSHPDAPNPPAPAARVQCERSW
jgi:hypothetical protein